jgi:hypothetical protein
MSWNYRVLAFIYEDEVSFRICEVYYNKDNKPNGYIEEKATQAESIEGLKWCLKKQLKALKKPILIAGDKFPQEYKIIKLK